MAESEIKAEHIVHKYSKWAAGVGLIPVPVLDVAALATVQVKMLSELSALYGTTFGEHRARNIIGTLLGALTPGSFTVPLISLVKSVPVIGLPLAVLTAPGLNAASTFALGRVFVQHLASGGTFLTFDPDAVKEHYRTHFEEAKKHGTAATKAA